MREKTERAHEEFKEMLKECLRTGKDIGKPFSQRIKDMFPEFLEAAARWGQQGAESARWTLNDDIISMLTILHVFVFRRFGHLILLFGLLVGFRLLLAILAIPYSYISLDPCLDYAPCYSFPLAQSSQLPRTRAK
jgi:hypothetical protein